MQFTPIKNADAYKYAHKSFISLIVRIQNTELSTYLLCINNKFPISKPGPRKHT